MLNTVDPANKLYIQGFFLFNFLHLYLRICGWVRSHPYHSDQAFNQPRPTQTHPCDLPCQLTRPFAPFLSPDRSKMPYWGGGAICRGDMTKALCVIPNQYYHHLKVCTPTIERDCEDVKVKTRTIQTREDCVEVVRTVCTEVGQNNGSTNCISNFIIDRGGCWQHGLLLCLQHGEAGG